MNVNIRKLGVYC